jgi:ribonuclease D
MNTMHHFQAPGLITTASALRRLVGQLASESVLAVDTESNSLYAYQERVCLIQFSTTHDDFLIDPLAIDDLSALNTLFADPDIEKVFHAAEYDLISLKRDYDFTFNNLFDTMIAARILGWEEVGLGSILKAEFGVQLNKRYQRANWGKRPLPPEMLAYARLDTHYLIPLSMRMKAALKAAGRWELAREDFSRLRYVNGRDPEDQPEIPWRIRGSLDLNPSQAAVLKEIALYREEVAKAINQPVFKVLNDRVLLAIAESCPEEAHALQKTPGLSDLQYQRHGKALLKAVQRGLKAAPLYPPQQTRPDDKYLARLDALRAWRKKTAQQLHVKSDVVLPRDLLYTLAARNPGDMKTLQELLAQVPWRMEHFGEQILKTLNGS